MEIERPYLMFLGDAPDDLAAKTAFGVAEWRPEWCIGQLRLDGCQTSLGLPDLEIAEAAHRGARTLIVGVANRGGVIPRSWHESLHAAIASGMDIASGLHEPLSSVPGLAEAAARENRRLIDVRRPDQQFEVANAKPRSGLRLLTVGTDCSVGKMYTSLAIEREMRERGMKADFRATGQTGIFIAGGGVSVDAVVADFISGAVEWLTPSNEDDHWDIVEGQGSLFHPSFAGVTLGLIHGSQPDALVLCHEPTRAHMRGLPDRALPSLRDCMEENLRAARMVNGDARFVGIAINTKRLDDDQARKILADVEQELGLPAVDPVRTGVSPIVDRLQSS